MSLDLPTSKAALLAHLDEIIRLPRGSQPHNADATRWSKAVQMLQQARGMVEGLDVPQSEMAEVLRELIAHCDAMEAQNADYHLLAEDGVPCRSAPLNNAAELLARVDGGAPPSRPEADSDLYEAGRKLLVRWEGAAELPVEMETALNEFEDAWLRADASRAQSRPEAEMVEALRVALKPFAKAADIKLCGEWRDDQRFGQTDVSSHLTFGDLRRARAALRDGGPDAQR